MICATLWTNALQKMLALAVGEFDYRIVATQRLYQLHGALLNASHLTRRALFIV